MMCRVEEVNINGTLAPNPAYAVHLVLQRMFSFRDLIQRLRAKSSCNGMPSGPKRHLKGRTSREFSRIGLTMRRYSSQDRRFTKAKQRSANS